jgi:hypothetical protein
MIKAQKDPLFVLIKSLTKSEKRQFKLYVGRLGVNEDSKFFGLFKQLDRLKVYNEKVILSSGVVKKQQLSNLKAHLYKQILISLRLNPSHQNLRLQIREQLDFASILYHKGLYKQSLKILDKAKSQAIANQEKNIAYEIVELEKIIESQYITRSLNNRADELTLQAKNLSQQNMIASKLSNLSLQLYGLFLKTGYVKNDLEYQKIRNYFNERLPKYNSKDLGFREKLWLYKSYLWYSFLIQDFKSCYKYARQWVDLFYDNPAMMRLNPVFFLQGYQYLLEALFFAKHYQKFKRALQDFEHIVDESWFSKGENINSLVFLYRYTNKFNLHFMAGTFKEGLPLVAEVADGLVVHSDKIDEHHVMLFYYKIACLYFGVGDYKNSIVFLSKIINNKSLQMREDLLCFSRILNLVAHYEAGLDYDLDRLIKSTYKFLIKMEDLYAVQKEMVAFLKGLGDIYPHELKSAFKQLYQKLLPFRNHPYERRAFLYLDIISWLKSKIENKSVETIIKENFSELSSKN